MPFITIFIDLKPADKMKNYLKLIIILPILIVPSVLKSMSENDEKRSAFNFSPSIGLTLNSSKNLGISTLSYQWLATINADYNYTGKKLDFRSTLYATYGQSKTTGQPVQSQQNSIILSLTPSVIVIKHPAIRLFLETTGETFLKKSTLNNQPVSLFDPLFLYQTLFIGQKHYSHQGKENTNWDLTYGLGYSFQQTFNKEFQTQSNINGSLSDFESGFSGIVDFSISTPVSKDVNFNLDFKAVALSRGNLFKEFNTSRKSVLLRSGFYYKQIGIEYNYHLVYDLNISPTIMTDHSLMLTLRF